MDEPKTSRPQYGGRHYPELGEPPTEAKERVRIHAVVGLELRERLEAVADEASRRAGFDRRVVSLSEIVRRAITLGVEQLEREEAEGHPEPAQG